MLLEGVLFSHSGECCLKYKVGYDYIKIHHSELYNQVLKNIFVNEKRELLQAKINAILDDFPIKANLDTIKCNAFNQVDPCLAIIKPKWDALFQEKIFFIVFITLVLWSKDKYQVVEGIEFNNVNDRLIWKIILNNVECRLKEFFSLTVGNVA